MVFRVLNAENDVGPYTECWHSWKEEIALINTWLGIYLKQSITPF